MKVSHLDHLVLTVRDIEETVKFYQSVPGMEKITFAGDRIARAYGNQKINLHQLSMEFEPKAGKVCAGSADLCFILSTPIAKVQQHLAACGVEIIAGAGATYRSKWRNHISLFSRS